MELNRKTVRNILILVAFAAAVFTALQHIGLVFGALGAVWRVFSTVFGGFCAAFVLNVFLRILETRVFGFMKKSPRKIVRALWRPVSLTVTVLLTLGLVTVLLVFVVPEILSTLAGFVSNLNTYVEEAVTWFDATLSNLGLAAASLPEVPSSWQEALNRLGELLSGSSGLWSTATSITASVLSGAAAVFFGLIIAIYVLARKEQIGDYVNRVLRAFLPERSYNWVQETSALADEVFTGFIKGQLVGAVVLGVASYVSLLLFRVPYAAIVAMILSVSTLIPIVGTFLGILVCTLLLLLAAPLKALLFLVILLVLHALERRLLKPLVAGKRMEVPGLLIVCGVVIGAGVGSVFGAFCAAPVCAVLYAIFRKWYDANRPRRQAEETPRDPTEAPVRQKSRRHGKKKGLSEPAPAEDAPPAPEPEAPEHPGPGPDRDW